MAYVRTENGEVYETANPEHWSGAQVLTAKDGREAMKADAIKRLRGLVRPGETVYCVLRHVSASGMSRRIDLYSYRGGAPVYLSGYAARALGAKLADKGGIVVGGCGMDMGFHLVYSLSSVVWPRYRCRGKRKDGRTACPSNYHSNHSDSIPCPGVERDGARVYCWRPRRWAAEETPADWPMRALSDGPDPVMVPASCLFGADGEPTREVCPTCSGAVSIPNPEGPERFDLMHADGYALRAVWQ